MRGPVPDFLPHGSEVMRAVNAHLIVPQRSKQGSVAEREKANEKRDEKSAIPGDITDITDIAGWGWVG